MCMYSPLLPEVQYTVVQVLLRLKVTHVEGRYVEILQRKYGYILKAYKYIVVLNVSVGASLISFLVMKYDG